MGMRLVVCSLKTNGPQTIPPNVYTVVRFPFGAAESYDPDNLHPAVQPDTGRQITASDPRAGLIWPAHTAWATLQGMMVWQDIAGIAAANRPTHFRHRFVRDPLGLAGEPDSTATSDHPPRPAGKGQSCQTKSWNIFVHPGVPVGYLVRHDAKVPLVLDLAEFKLSYWVQEPES